MSNTTETSASKLTSLVAQARNILYHNDVDGKYTVPTRNGLYPAQWLWDSAFVGLAFHYLGDPQRGWQEIATLFDGQWDNGMVPHILFHGDDSSYFPNSTVWQAGNNIPSSGISQPPIIAYFMRKMIDSPAATDYDKQRLSEIFPKLLAYHRWYHTHRNHNGLVKLIHPWESGFDNNQSYEAALHAVPLENLQPYTRKDNTHADSEQRPHDTDYDHYVALIQHFRGAHYADSIANSSPFQLVDVGVNAMLLRADHDLYHLASLLQHTEAQREIAQWISQLSNSLETLWDGDLELYTPLNILTGQRIPMPSINGMLPLFGQSHIDADRLHRMCSVARRWMDAVALGLPSFDPHHQAFEPRRYCRGPAWPVWSWLVAEGLRHHGNEEIARTIVHKTIGLIAESGYYEYFDPLTGDGCGGSEFSWSAAIMLFMVHDYYPDISLTATPKL